MLQCSVEQTSGSRQNQQDFTEDTKFSREEDPYLPCRSLTEEPPVIESSTNSANKLDLDVGYQILLQTNPVQVLLPNGVLLEVVVSHTATVLGLKTTTLTKVFDQINKYPRVGLLTSSPSFYSLVYVSREGVRTR